MRHLKLILMIIVIPAILLSCDGKKDDKPLGGVPTENRMPGLGEVAPAVVFEAPDTELTDLIPANACGVVYVRSAADFFEKISAMVQRVDPEAAGEIQLDMAMGEMLEGFRAGSLTTEMLDMSRPMAMAAILTEGRRGPEPVPVVILPVKDAEKAEAAVDGGERGPSHASAGGYLAFCPAPRIQLGTGGSKLGGNMPAGDIVVRLDLAALIDAFGSDLKGQFNEGLQDGMRDVPPGMEGLADSIKGIMNDFLDSAEGLDICASVGAEMVDLHCFFTAKKGSALASASAPSGDLMNLAGCLPAEFPMSVLVSADLSKVMEWMKPLMEASLENMPPEAAEKFNEFWQKSLGMTSGLGNEIVMAMDFGKDGIQLVEVFTAKDPQKYVADMESMISEDIAGAMRESGVEMVIGEKTEVAGHEVHNWTMVFDFEKLMTSQPGARDIPPQQLEEMEAMFTRMLGKGGMKVRMAVVGNRIVMAVSGDDAILEKAIAAAGASDVGPSGTLSDAVTRIGATPKFLMHMDLRAFAGQLMDLVRDMAPARKRDEIPEMPRGGAIPFTMYYTGSGQNHAMGTSVSLGQILDLVKHFMNEK